MGPQNEHGSEDGHDPTVPGVPGERLVQPALPGGARRGTRPPRRRRCLGRVHRVLPDGWDRPASPRAQKKPAWANPTRNSPMPAYSSTDPPTWSGCPSLRHPTIASYDSVRGKQGEHQMTVLLPSLAAPGIIALGRFGNRGFLLRWAGRAPDRDAEHIRDRHENARGDRSRYLPGGLTL